MIRNRHALTLVLITILAAVPAAALAQGAGAAAAAKVAEHPAALTAADMAKSIQTYIDTDTALKGGFFLVFDPVQKSVLQMNLDKIHLDKLAKVGDGLYFACCDFRATDGNTYDLDFFMKGKAMPLSVSEITVHKDNGKPRYGWEEKDGVWGKVAVK